VKGSWIRGSGGGSFDVYVGDQRLLLKDKKKNKKRDLR
jgi:hypothetical protein